MPAILPVVSTMAPSEQGSPPGQETTGSNNGARSEGGVSNDTNGPTQTWTQPSANSDQSSKQTSFGNVLNASVTGTSKTKAKSSTDPSPASASPAIPDIVTAVAVPLPTFTPPVTPAGGILVPGQPGAQGEDPAQLHLAQAPIYQVSTGNHPVEIGQSMASHLSGIELPSGSAVPSNGAAPEAVTQSTFPDIQSTQADSPAAQASAAAAQSNASETAQLKSDTPAIKLSAASASTTSTSSAGGVEGLQITGVRHESASDSNSGGSSDSNSQSGTSSQQAAGNALTSQSAVVPAATAAAQAAVTSSSVAERVSVINQITQQVAATAGANSSSGTQTVTVHVSPPHWGDMSINLTSQTASDGKAGPITATITTQSIAAKDALTAHASDLKSTLSASGIKLDKLEITTSDRNITTQVTLASDRTAAASNAQGSGMQSNTGNQQFGSQHNPSGSHFGQGASSALSDQSGGGHSGQQAAFASMLNGDGQPGRGNYASQNLTDLIDMADEQASNIFTGVSGTSSGAGINVLA